MKTKNLINIKKETITRLNLLDLSKIIGGAPESNYAINMQENSRVQDYIHPNTINNNHNPNY